MKQTLSLLFALAMLAAVGCVGQAQVVAPKDVIAHPELHAFATVEGRLTAPFAVLPIPGRQAVLRKLVGTNADSLIIHLPISADTFATGRVIRVSGRVHAGSAFSGLIKTGPVLMLATRSDTAERPTGTSPPPTPSRP